MHISNKRTNFATEVYNKEELITLNKQISVMKKEYVMPEVDMQDLDTMENFLGASQTPPGEPNEEPDVKSMRGNNSGRSGRDLWKEW